MLTPPENVPQRRSPPSCCKRLASLVIVADPRQSTRKVGAADGATVVGAAVVGVAVVGTAVVGAVVVGVAVVGAVVVGIAVVRAVVASN